MKRIVLLEGKTDMFYIKKMYQLINYADDILYIPCGGATEIWPVVEALQWRWKGKKRIEAWVDNDYAGIDTKHRLNRGHPYVQVRILGENSHLGCIENEVGFLAPKTYDQYHNVKKIKVKHSKAMKSEYKLIKEQLFGEIMAIQKTTIQNQQKIIQFFKSVGVEIVR